MAQVSESEFSFDRANRIVTVSLPPDQGLLIHRGGEYAPNPPSAEEFIIDEIRIAKNDGEIILQGDDVPRAFLVVPKPIFTFGPPTLLKLTIHD